MSEPKRSRNRSFKRLAFMDHNTPKTWIHSALGKELAEASIRRETDRDARRLSLSTDELRHHAEAVEGNASSSREALSGVFPNGLRADRSNRPNRIGSRRMCRGSTGRIGLKKTDRSRRRRRKPQPHHEDQRLERAQIAHQL